MLIKIIIILLLAVILYCLGSGVYHLLRDGRNPQALAKALTWRSVVSFVIFLLLILAYLFGWIAPHGLAP